MDALAEIKRKKLTDEQRELAAGWALYAIKIATSEGLNRPTEARDLIRDRVVDSLMASARYWDGQRSYRAYATHCCYSAAKRAGIRSRETRWRPPTSADMDGNIEAYNGGSSTPHATAARAVGIADALVFWAGLTPRQLEIWNLRYGRPFGSSSLECSEIAPIVGLSRSGVLWELGLSYAKISTLAKLLELEPVYQD
jgi:hypothetical protein